MVHEGMDFIKGVAKEISQYGVAKKATDFGKRYMKMGDEEIARSVVRRAKNNPDSEFSKLLEDGMTADKVKGAYKGHVFEQYQKQMDGVTDPEILKAAKESHKKKAETKWQHAGYSDYFTKETNGGMTKKRMQGLGAIAGATYVAGSVASRVTGPGTITRDEYGNKDLMGIPFI